MKTGCILSVVRVVFFTVFILVLLFVVSGPFVEFERAWPKQFVWIAGASFFGWVCCLKVFGKTTWKRFCFSLFLLVLFATAGWQIAIRIKCAPPEKPGYRVSSIDKTEQLFFVTDSIVLRKFAIEPIEKSTGFAEKVPCSLEEVKWMGPPTVVGITGYRTEVEYAFGIEKFGFSGDVIFGTYMDGGAFLFQNRSVEFLPSASELTSRLSLNGITNFQMRAVESFFE